MPPMNWNGRRVTAAVLLSLLVTCAALAVGISLGRDLNPAPITNNTYNTNVGGSGLTNNAPVTPTNDAQRAMLDQFRLATSTEATLLQNQPDFKHDPAFQHIYVATKTDVTLVPVATPMVLVLPEGHKWVDGPASMITIVRVPALTTDGLSKYGVPFADPLCDLQRFGVLKGNCLDLSVQKPATWNEMVRNTRYPTEGELQRWLGDQYIKGQTRDYLVATRDLRVAPQYTFDGSDGFTGVIALFVPTGVKVLGGQLGYMDVIPVSNSRYTSSVLDTSCFMHNGPVPMAEPATFAPAAEIKRVERCTRR